MLLGNYYSTTQTISQHHTHLREVERAMVCAAAAEIAELNQSVTAHEEVVHFQIPERKSSVTDPCVRRGKRRPSENRAGKRGACSCVCVCVFVLIIVEASITERAIRPQSARQKGKKRRPKAKTNTKT